MDSPLLPVALNVLKEKIILAENNLTESSQSTRDEMEKIKADFAESKSKYASISSQIVSQAEIGGHRTAARPGNISNKFEQELRITQSKLENSQETIKSLEQKISLLESASNIDKIARNKEVHDFVVLVSYPK